MANDKDDGTGDKPIQDTKTTRKEPATKKKTAIKSSETKYSSKKAPTGKAASGKPAEAAPVARKKSSPRTAPEASAEATSGDVIKRAKLKKDKRTGSEGRRTEDKVMPGLLKNLQGVFDKIYSDNRVRDRSHDQLAEEFTTHMQRAFLEMHKQIEEREHLLETRLKSIDRTHQYQWRSVKLLSVPVTLLSLIAIVYLFYVVRVMETSMTSMSQDMHMMTAYMETITTDTTALSANTQIISVNTDDMTQSVSDMNAQMTTLNTNVGNLMVDMNYMSRSVSPAMKGINRFIP